MGEMMETDYNGLPEDGNLGRVVTYTKSKTDEPLDSWTYRHLPSNISKEQGVAWISVQRFPHLHVDYPDLEGLEEAWEDLQQSGRPINYQNIKELACNHNVKYGKWFFFSNSGGKVDHLWSIVASQVINGDCNMPCCSAKVSAYDSGDCHVICIYNSDFSDKEQVLISEHSIRNMGIKCPMMYKPDVYTYLDIYSRNPWGIKPTIMKSEFDLKSGTSVVETLV